MKSLALDLRHTVRTLWKSPGFTVAALLCLALTIGAASAVFSVVQGVLLRALPYEDPDRIVILAGPGAEREFRPSSADELLDYRSLGTVFERVEGSLTAFLNLTGEGDPERLVATRMTPGYMDLLGVRAPLGRTFGPDDAGESVVVLSHGLWSRRFARDPAILDRQITLDGAPYKVVGVAPESLHFKFGPVESDVYLPLQLDAARLPPRHVRAFAVAARLQPSVLPGQAQEQIDALGERLQGEFPPAYPDPAARFFVIPLREQVVSAAVRRSLLVLFGAVGLVLVIACVNLANLMLSRAIAREGEVALRTALGARRTVLVRQFLLEALALAAVGGALGLLLAWWGLRLLVALGPEELPRVQEIGLDAGGFAFTALVTLATTLAFGLAPALHALRARVQSLLVQGGKGTAGGSGRTALKSGLIVAEVALALVLLVGAGLVTRSFAKVSRVDPGFRPENVLTFQVFLSPTQYPTPQERATTAELLGEKLRALPNVERVGVINGLPLTDLLTSADTEIEGRPPVAGEPPLSVDWRSADPGYFQTLGIDLLRGRLFSGSDQAGAPEVAVVDETLADRAWPGESPLGKRLKLNQPMGWTSWLTVVGVVRHVRAHGLDAAAEPQVYTPFAQTPRPLMSFALRTGRPPLELAAATRQAVWSVDRNLPVEKIRTLEEIVDDSLAGRRSFAWLFGIFAGVALVLVSVGIYGVMAYAVSQRVREIGIRMSLGAQRREILGLIVGQSLVLAGIGVAVGLVLAVGLSRFLASLLFDVSVTDAATLASVVVLVLALALLASFLPARRATRIEPTIALRTE